jgi:hypothetical protein
MENTTFRDITDNSFWDIGACFMLFSCLSYFSTLKKEATCSTWTLVGFQWITWRYIPEDSPLHFALCLSSVYTVTTSKESDIYISVPKYIYILGLSVIFSFYFWVYTLVCSSDIYRGRNSSVGIVTGYMLDGWGSNSAGARYFFPFLSVQTGSGAHPLSNGYRRLFPGVKLAVHEADHSPPSRA